MTDQQNISSISGHIKRKGILVTPLNAALGDKLKLSSWAKERMPEYLWLGLILSRYGRNEGLIKAEQILFDISKTVEALSQPRLSLIFSLPGDDQRKVYEIFNNFIDKETLAPLTLIYRNKNYPIFNEYFFISHISVNERIELLSKAVELYSPHQSNEATDLKFLAMCLLLFRGKLVFVKGTELTITAFKEYPYTDHDDEKMNLYRPAIRSTEGGMGAMLDEYNNEFSSNFWKDLGVLTQCNPMTIEFLINPDDYNEFLVDSRKAIEYVYYSNKEKSLTDDKFSVVVGFVNYAIKIFSEINNSGLGNGILGREGLRTIIESFIMIKYLIKKESEHPNIWRDYKLYGISKYKLILLKARESDFLDKSSHFSTIVIDALVNEFMSEEVINVDLRYFDNQNIREKSIEVGEKQLYDLFYDYDSNFSHALWGAIREGAMLFCNNASHQYHTIPDLYANQILPDVKSDCIRLLKMLFLVFSELYDLPPSYIKKYLTQ